MKILTLVAIISAVVFTASLIGLMVGYSTTPPGRDQSSHSIAARELSISVDADRKPFWGKVWSDPVSAFTLWLAVFTAVLGFASVLQLGALNRAEAISARSADAAKDAADAAKEAADAAQKSILLTQQAMRLDQRAWLGIENIVPNPSSPEVGKPFQVTVVFRNAGKTPAIRISGNLVVDPVSQGQQPNFSYVNDMGFNLGLMPPGRTDNTQIVVTNSRSTGKPSPLTPELLDELQTERTKFFVHGKINYDDIFGQHHWTTFCAKLIVPFNGQFGSCSEHNDSDDSHQPRDKSSQK